jgi:hypothetical protein
MIPATLNAAADLPRPLAGLGREGLLQRRNHLADIHFEVCEGLRVGVGQALRAMLSVGRDEDRTNL